MTPHGCNRVSLLKCGQVNFFFCTILRRDCVAGLDSLKKGRGHIHIGRAQHKHFSGSVTKLNWECDKILAIRDIHSTADYRQYWHVGDQVDDCKWGFYFRTLLFSVGELQDSNQRQEGNWCILAVSDQATNHPRTALVPPCLSTRH